MANVGANLARTAEAYLCVQVRPIHIDLTPVIVHDFANLFDALLENTVSRWIRHHQGSQMVLVDCRLCAQITEVDVARVIASHRDHFQSRLNSGQVTGNISTAAFNFIVQEPSGIIEIVSDKSRAYKRFKYRSISVSE